MRLAKYLAHGGVASRRASEEIIRAGRVTVGGEVITDPARDVDETSGVQVDGAAVGTAEPREVWALNKPPGVVSTASEPGSRPAVTELIESERRLYPVGRLDADSTGLLLLTNDGELANRLMHPRYGVRKTYRIELAKPPTGSEIDRLRKGVMLEDGPTRPAKVGRVAEFVLEVEIGEGRKRQVKRMAEAIGHRVVSLERIRFGPLNLGPLAIGQSRKLTATEVKRLWEDSQPMSERQKK